MAVAWLALLAWVALRWQRRPRRDGPGSCGAAAPADPLVHLLVAALPDPGGGAWLAEAAVGAFAYDAAAGAAALWAMGGRWRSWLLAWWAWAAALLWLYASPLHQKQPKQAAGAPTSCPGAWPAAARLGAALALQVALPLYMGLRLAWP
jgi:hypothetical protein